MAYSPSRIVSAAMDMIKLKEIGRALLTIWSDLTAGPVWQYQELPPLPVTSTQELNWRAPKGVVSKESSNGSSIKKTLNFNGGHRAGSASDCTVGLISCRESRYRTTGHFAERLLQEVAGVTWPLGSALRDSDPQLCIDAQSLPSAGDSASGSERSDASGQT